MIRISAYANRTVAVLGLGRTGVAAAKALAAGGARVEAWDDYAPARAAAEAQGLACRDLAGIEWRSVAALVLSPGIPHLHPKPHPLVVIARAVGCPIISDFDLLAGAQPDATYVGITGTNGKSTTTALIGHIVAAARRPVQVGGNLGTSALALEPLGQDGAYVLEASSYQLDITRALAFDVAVLLNITPDHLGRHGGMDGYIAAKARIFARQDAASTAVIGIDDDHCRRLAETLRTSDGPTVVEISTTRQTQHGVHVLDGILFDATGDQAVSVIDLRTVATLPGAHNWQNAAAAYAATKALGLAPARIADAIRSFPGLAHRQERIAVIDGVAYVNDSKATNPDAAAKALASYQTIYWIAGGRPKEGGLELVMPHLGPVRRAFLIGEAADAFAKELEGHVAVRKCGTLAIALAEARAAALADGIADAVVLLSPACASFDQFRDFEERGQIFVDLVRALPRAQGGAVARSGERTRELV